MKAALLRLMLFVAGLALIGWGVLSPGASSAGAAPPLVVTETSTAEPPTPTEPPAPTATEIGELTPVPTDTPAPTSTLPPEEPPDRPRDTATPTAAPPTPTAEPAPAPPPDPAISKTVSPGTATVGENVEYTITVVNIGGSVATGVVVEDTLPAIVTPTGVTTSKGEASVNGQTIRVTIGDLSPGETVTITVGATVVAPSTPSNNRNLAVVSSTSPDANLANNEASVPLDTLAPVVLPETASEPRDILPIATALLGLVLITLSALAFRRSA